MGVNDILRHSHQFDKIEVIDPDEEIAKNILRQIMHRRRQNISQKDIVAI